MKDIKSFAVNQTGRLHLRNADEELMYADDEKQLPIAIVLYSPGSKQYAKAQAAQQNRMIDKLKKKGNADQTAEQMAEEKAEFLSDCTQSFENLVYDELAGTDLFKAVYSDTNIGFIADQVAKFLGVWGNFTKASTTI